MDILGKIRYLKADITKSPDYNMGETSRANKMAQEIISVLIDRQSRTMDSGYNPAPRVLDNMIGMKTAFIKNKIAIVSDINMIKRDVSGARDINPQLTKYINSRLEMMKR